MIKSSLSYMVSKEQMRKTLRYVCKQAECFTARTALTPKEHDIPPFKATECSVSEQQLSSVAHTP